MQASTVDEQKENDANRTRKEIISPGCTAREQVSCGEIEIERKREKETGAAASPASSWPPRRQQSLFSGGADCRRRGARDT